MESIYYVVCWHCHRTCAHCYEDRFHPYHGDDLERVLRQAEAAFPAIVRNLPEEMTYLDRTEGAPTRRTGSIILAGGEVLVQPVRERVLYPVLGLLREKYATRGGVKLIVQTTGDVLTAAIAAELRDLGVWTISVSGIDEYHQGLETLDAQSFLRAKLTRLLEGAGFEHFAPVAQNARAAADDGRYYHFFGATPDSWIGRLWPRGRAMTNGLSTATMEDNFCARWSGGLNFLESDFNGSEVSLDPEGNVYPCCLKTRLPLGSAARESLPAILARLRGNPVYEAINRGEPDQMGLSAGWSRAVFHEKSRTVLPDGRVYANLCIGCDRFHEEVLAAAQVGEPR